MLLEVKREPSEQGCTLGTLTVDGEFECFTLEGAVREVPEEAVEIWKVAGETAIPIGTYEVTVNMSARFGRLLPLLLNVPGFQGVRIHSGNVAADTEGCILVGARRTDSAVLDSRLAFRSLICEDSSGESPQRASPYPDQQSPFDTGTGASVSDVMPR